jgi:hypothetical protein
MLTSSPIFRPKSDTKSKNYLVNSPFLINQSSHINNTLQKNCARNCEFIESIPKLLSPTYSFLYITSANEEEERRNLSPPPCPSFFFILRQFSQGHFFNHLINQVVHIFPSALFSYTCSFLFILSISIITS